LEAVDEMIKEFGHEGGCILEYWLPEWMVFSVENEEGFSFRYK
jgi:hypothetical protein